MKTIIIIVLALMVLQPVSHVSFWLDYCNASPLKTSTWEANYQYGLMFTCQNGDFMIVPLDL